VAPARKFIGPDPASAFKNERYFLLVSALGLFKFVCLFGVFLILDLPACVTPFAPAT